MWPLRGSKECGSESLWWPAPHVKENWGHWGGEDPKREKNKSNAPALGEERWSRGQALGT